MPVSMNWSLDAPSFAQGDRSPGVGLFILALAPNILAPDLPERLALQIERLAAAGIHIPGRQPVTDDLVLPPALARYAAG